MNNSYENVDFIITTMAFAVTSREAVTQYVLMALSQRVRCPGRDADLTRLYSIEVKNAWKYTSVLPIQLHSKLLRHISNFQYSFGFKVEKGVQPI